MKATRMYGTHESETFMKDGALYRRCIFCGEIKSLVDSFPKNGTLPDGSTAYRLDCKTCYNIRRHENRNKKVHSDFVGGQKRRGDAPTLTHQEWKEILIFFGGECVYCGCTPKRGQRLTKDHLLAMAKGGKTTQGNIVCACSTCNCSKRDEDFKDWFMRQPFFSQERLNKIFKWRMIMRIAGGNQTDE